MNETSSEVTERAGGTIDLIEIARIMHAIPHRYPFLMIDRVVDVVRNKSAIGVKNVSVNEHYFQGHFPGHPVMPGVLILEALAQASALMSLTTTPEEQRAGKVIYFMAIDKARFRKPVVPGDQLLLTAQLERSLRGIWKFSTVALVGDHEVAHADMMLAPEAGG